MASWRIKEWSREAGRGQVQLGHDSLSFDGHFADVDNFDVGEEVVVELSKTEEHNPGVTIRMDAPRPMVLKVTRVSPVRPRMEPRPSAAAPPLTPEVKDHAASLLAKVADYLDFRVSKLSQQSLEIEVDDDGFASPPFPRLILEPSLRRDAMRPDARVHSPRETGGASLAGDARSSW